MKIKQFGLVATLFLGALMLSGCGNQNSSKSESHPKTTVKATKSKSTKTKKKNTTDQKSTLWNDTKDKQLERFINQWAPTMKQSYVKYNGTDSLKTSVGTTYPDDLSKVSVEGTNSSIGWSKTGKGNYSYNVVAIYNYDGTRPPLPNHITYFFTFHDGEPIVLVDQSRDGTPNLLETKNTKVKESFNAIVDGSYKADSGASSDTSDTKTDDSASKETVTDPKMIGTMVYELCTHNTNLQSLEFLSVYTSGGRYWIGTGTSASNVGFTIDGNTVHYWTRRYNEETDNTDEIEHTMSIEDLEKQFYSTADQKQYVQSIANGMPDIDGE